MEEEKGRKQVRKLNVPRNAQSNAGADSDPSLLLEGTLLGKCSGSFLAVLRTHSWGPEIEARSAAGKANTLTSEHCFSRS